MILPTNTYRDEEVQHESGYSQILSDLHLSAASQYSAAEIVYLPSPLPSPETNEPRLGPIQEAISEWLETLTELLLRKTGTTRSDLVEHAPKRWSIYEPMLLLPSGSFQDTAWRALLQHPDETNLSCLWRGILHAVWKKEGGKELTHLAINCGIPLKQSSHSVPIPSASPFTSQENILRSPSGLVLLHGSFGPPLSPSAALAPTAQDFAAAFWVSTKQNSIVQTWAPRHTMFSRGNIKEKARVLSFHSPFPGPAAAAARGRVTLEERGKATAIDLYSGIGYFAFSYAAAGFGRVVCWEINPWSVEGLRRGCLKNGWSCQIVRESELERPAEEILRDDANVVVFEESNERAAGRMEAIKEWENAMGGRMLGDVLHVNCGFLPSSEASWRSAWRLVCKSRSAWLHLHENVSVYNVENKRKEIEKVVGKWAMEEGTSQVEVEHVELVKTFAPGVWHCVYDVHVQSAVVNGN
jgi:tRNA wybutosine-synthesizing protein 2